MFVGYRVGAACSAYPTVVGGPGVYRAYECWARRARTICCCSSDRWRHGELFQSKLTPSHDHIRSWIRDLPGPVAVTYEAGPTGFGLSRALNDAGIRCMVAAPSKLQRPTGDRVKTDAKDSIHLARLLRLDEVTPVATPGPPGTTPGYAGNTSTRLRPS
jgi:hypothetical protein